MKFLEKLFCSTLFPIIALSIVACNSTSDNVLPPVDLELQVTPEIRIVYDSDLLARSVGIDSSSVDTTKGTPRAVINIKNTAGVAYTIEYQVVWMDEFGAPQQSSSSWARKSMPQNGEYNIVSMAKEPNMKKVKVHFRLPSDVEIWIPRPNPIQEYHNQQNQ